MQLYYCEVLNPRKACAAALYLGAPVEMVRVDIFKGAHKTPDFLARNPNGQVPVLQDGASVLTESNAIMCHMSDRVGADFWPHDGRQIDVLRWLFWDANHFSRWGGELYFQNVILPFVGGAPDAAAVEDAGKSFRRFAAVLDTHLRGRDCIVGESWTVADFAVGAPMAYAAAASLPLDGFPNLTRWYARLDELPGWHNPFPANPDPWPGKPAQ